MRPETVRRVVEQLRAKAASTTFPEERASFTAKAAHLEEKYDLAPQRRAADRLGDRLFDDDGRGFARAGSSWANRVDEHANRIRQDADRIRQRRAANEARARATPPPRTAGPWGGNWAYGPIGVRFTTTTNGSPSGDWPHGGPDPHAGWQAEADARAAAVDERLRRMEAMREEQLARDRLRDLLDPDAGSDATRQANRAYDPPPRGPAGPTPFTDARRRSGAAYNGGGVINMDLIRQLLGVDLSGRVGGVPRGGNGQTVITTDVNGNRIVFTWEG